MEMNSLSVRIPFIRDLCVCKEELSWWAKNLKEWKRTEIVSEKQQNLFCKLSLQSEDHSYDSERGHGISEAQISIVHTVGVVGPAPAII